MADKFPIQPMHVDEQGTLRFKANRIVRYLLDEGGIDLNRLAVAFADEEYNAEREQFAQLIGYSLSGFSELSYVSDETYEAAQAMAGGGTTEQEARIEYLESRLAATRKALKELVPQLFRIHPDDLTT